MIGKLKDLLRLSGGEWLVSFVTRENPAQLFDDLKDKAVKVDIKKASQHRSLSANNYAWVLIDQITEKLQDSDRTGKWTPEKVYQQAIREIGGISKVVGIPENYFEDFKKLWIGDHLGRQVQIIPGSTKPGWINVRAWKGSSDFDGAQMARLIDSLIQDAESLGIPTVPDKEVERMVGQWQTVSCKKKNAVTSAGQ